MTNIIEIKEEDIKDLLSEEETNGYSFIEKSNWVADGKYDFREFVITRISDNTFWQGSYQRSGSPFSDYEYYYDTSLCQVIKKEIVRYEWVMV